MLSRRLILLSLDWTRPKDPPLSLGHASILANLVKKGVNVASMEYSVNSPSYTWTQVVEDIENMLKSFGGNLANTDIGIGAFIWNETSVQNITESVKQLGFPGRVILGGPQVSYSSPGIEHEYPYADVFIRGYAEDVMFKLMTAESNKPIKGVHYRGEPDLAWRSQVDLDNLTSPYLSGLIKPQPFLRWETQRGCPFMCSFCQHRESGDHLKRRNLLPKRVEDEIDFFCKNNVDDLAVLDPTFNSGPFYLDVLRRFVRNKYRGKIALQSRFEMVKEPYLDLCEQLNETGLVQLEFGLQTIHSNEAKAVRRGNPLERIKRSIMDINSRNLLYEVSIIFGLPNQTLESFEETVQFCLDHKVPVVKAFPLMLLRGTELEEKKEEWDLIESPVSAGDLIDRVQDGIPHVVASSSFTVEDWSRMAEIANNLARTEGNHPASVDELAKCRFSQETETGDGSMSRIYECNL